MEERTSPSGPAATGPFDHPNAPKQKEQSSDDKSGYQDQAEYAASESAKDAAARGEVLPPRAATSVSREPLTKAGRK